MCGARYIHDVDTGSAYSREVLAVCIQNLDILTDYVQESDLALHRIRVYLAHVPATVGLANLFDVQVPRTVVAVTDPDSVVLRNHVAVDGEDGLRVYSKPCDLRTRKTAIKFAAKSSL